VFARSAIASPQLRGGWEMRQRNSTQNENAANRVTLTSLLIYNATHGENQSLDIEPAH